MGNAQDEWRVKNQHCADEIDERQAMELAVILVKWKKKEIPPLKIYCNGPKSAEPFILSAYKLIT